MIKNTCVIFVYMWLPGNAGCGVWVMAAEHPLIHGNEIHSNRDMGISLVHKLVSGYRSNMIKNSKKD